MWTGEAAPIPTIIPTGKGTVLPTVVLAKGPDSSIYEVAGGYNAGAKVSISPHGIAGLAATARASGGLIVAFRLKALAPGRASITISRAGHVLGVIPIIVGPPFPSTESSEQSSGHQPGG